MKYEALKYASLWVAGSSNANPTGLSQVRSGYCKCRTTKPFVLLHRTIEHRTEPKIESILVSALLQDLTEGLRGGTFYLF